MSLYVMSKSYITRALSGFCNAEEIRERRLMLDLQAILTGPVSSAEAERIIGLLFDTSSGAEVAAALAETCARFNGKGESQ